MNLDSIATNYRILALDGCDGAGKTTLADLLTVRYGFTRTHSSRTPNHIDLTSHYQWIIGAEGRLVLDRCFISELVYGPLFRNYSRLTWDDATKLAAGVAAQGGAFVHVTGLSTVIHRRLQRRPDAVTPPIGDVEDILSTYRDVFLRLSGYVRVIEVDTTSPGHLIA